MVTMESTSESDLEQGADEVAILKKYCNALIEIARRDAFNSFLQTWSNEQGALRSTAIPATLDAMTLTAVVDNRKVIIELLYNLRRVTTQIETIQKQLQRVS